MRKKIIVFIILLTSSLPLLLQAQPAAKKSASPNIEIKNGKVDGLDVPTYNGLSLGVDLFGIGNKLFGGDYISSELSLNANFKNRYFPVIEIGYGHIDMTDDNYNIHYKSAAPFARIGLDYNTMAKKMQVGYLTVGLRYGFTAFNYDVSSPDLKDPIWQGTLPYEHTGIHSTAHWLEAVAAINVKIAGSFHMGWSVRYKARFNAKKDRYATPEYLPGFGKNKSGIFGFTYNLIYKLPF